MLVKHFFLKFQFTFCVLCFSRFFSRFHIICSLTIYENFSYKETVSAILSHTNRFSFFLFTAICCLPFIFSSFSEFRFFI